MNGELAGLFRRLVSRSIALAALSIWVGASPTGLAQPANGRPAPNLDAQALGSETLSQLPAFLAEKYPNLRALALVRGNCLAFEYYRKDIGVETRSRVHSITKSVLSILAGIALDRGYLRLDQKLSELLPEVSEKSVDPRVGDITVRDRLTMTSGFDPATRHVPIPTSKMWRRFIDRPMLYSRGSHFNYDEHSG